MGSPPPPPLLDSALPQSPVKSYSQAAAPGSKDHGDPFVNVVRYSPVADLQGGIASVDLPEALLSDSQPLWSAYIVGHFMGDAPHIGKVHAIVNRIWSFPDRPAKIDAQFISPKTVLFRIDNPQLKDRVLKRTFWHIADIPIVVREWSPKTASAQPDLTAVPLWVDLFGVPDHLFSQNGLTFFGDTIGRTVKLHPNTERCARLDVARVLVVMNLEEPIPTIISVKGSGEVITVSYPWLPPRCNGCQKWGHTYKNCPKNKKNKEKEEDSKQSPHAEANKAGGSQAESESGGGEPGKENSKTIDIEKPVLEVANLTSDEAAAQRSSTKENPELVADNIVMGNTEQSINSDKEIQTTSSVPVNNEEWLTIPQKSPTGRRTHERSNRNTEIELPSASSPSRFHLLSNELEEGEMESSESSDEESSVESQAEIERKKQLEKQKLGKNKKSQNKSQKSNPNVNMGGKKDQTKGAKNNKANQASSRRH